MNRLSVGFLCITAVTFLIGCGSQTQEGESAVSASQETVTAFTDVNVLPMDRERVLEGQTVIVRGDRIAEVGPAGDVAVPDGAREIDGQGQYLVPGFAELHGHIPNPNSQPSYTNDILFMYLANGVTTVRGMQGRSGQLELRKQANAGEILSPTLYLAGPPFTGNSVDGPDDARRMVRDQEEAGWDYLKVLEGMSAGEYDAMAQTARRVEIPYVGHVPNDVGLARVLEAGQETIDHLDGYMQYLNGAEREVPEQELQEVVQRTNEAGVCVVPTMALWETLQGTAALETLETMAGLEYMPPDLVNDWTESHRRRLDDVDESTAQQVIENRMRLLTVMNEGDACILFGTDSPQQFSVPGFSIHREIQRMEEAGMTPYEILASGTRAVGEYFSDKDDFGTVAAGQRADLILLGANPLEDIGHLEQPAGVMVRGQWLSEAEIQQGLEEIARSYD